VNAGGRIIKEENKFLLLLLLLVIGREPIDVTHVSFLTPVPPSSRDLLAYWPPSAALCWPGHRLLLVAGHNGYIGSCLAGLKKKKKMVI
jgi:hypothetical protein